MPATFCSMTSCKYWNDWHCVPPLIDCTSPCLLELGLESAAGPDIPLGTSMQEVDKKLILDDNWSDIYDGDMADMEDYSDGEE